MKLFFFIFRLSKKITVRQFLLRKEGYSAMTSSSSFKVVKEYIKIIVTAAIIYSIISVSFVKAYHIESGSMEYTLLEGDKIMVNKFIYGVRLPYVHWRLPALRDPQPGDIIVFEYPYNSSIQYVKRCAAIPGQTIEISPP